MMGMNSKRSAILAALVAAGSLAATGAVALIAAAGGSEIRIDVRSEVAPSSTSAVGFVDLPGANLVVAVPVGGSRLFTARFTAESQCFGAAASPAAYCSVRVIATNTTSGITTEFNPAAGIDFAFDSNPPGAADDRWEGNAIERSLRLQGGQYRIRVQRAVTNAATIFRLDDWHFAVETNT